MAFIERARSLVDEVREFETRSVEKLAQPENFVTLVSGRVLLESAIRDFEHESASIYPVKSATYSLERLYDEARTQTGE